MSVMLVRRMRLSRRSLVTIVGVALAVCGGRAPAGAQTVPSDPDALRSRIEARFDIVPLRDAIGLRPKNTGGGIRMIEVSDGTISIDGSPVSGRELRDRVGSDADLIIPLSYYDAAQRRAFVREAEARPVEPPREPAPAERRSESRPHRRVGERVRIFGSVVVGRDEEVDGQVVAVLGSVRVDGRVSDQVVAVLGSVDLGPDAVVDGDVVSVGGRVNKADTAQISGNVTEVSLPSSVHVRGPRWLWGVPFLFGPFDGAARFVGTLFRFFVLGLLASLVVLVIPRPTEQVGHRIAAEPVKMALIGFVVQLLLFPVLILTIVILAISIIGIPLLLFVPFAIIGLLFVLLGGFTAAAYMIGGWAAGRTGWNAEQPYARVWLGILVVLAPLFVARLFGVVGGPFNVFAFMIAAIAALLEYVVWTTGFGGALMTGFEGWRTRRTPPTPAQPPVAPAQ